MEQTTLEDLKQLAAKGLSEVREVEQGLERQRNTEGSGERVPPFHTPIGVERGTRRALAGENGLSVIGESDRQKGRTFDHPWLGRIVDSPKGRGRLGWTDGYRAAISPRPNFCWLVDLTEVRMPASDQ